jgi:hypothetical protein
LRNWKIISIFATKEQKTDMPQLLITVSDSTHLPHLRTAIRQLKGVEQVAMLRSAKKRKSLIRQGKLHRELQERVDSFGQFTDGWDGSDSKAIEAVCIRKFKAAIEKTDEKLLQGWLLFPDAHGYLYLDYTGGNAVAGITMTNDRMIYFFKKDGKTIKNDRAAFTTRNFLAILERVHG